MNAHRINHHYPRKAMIIINGLAFDGSQRRHCTLRATDVPTLRVQRRSTFISRNTRSLPTGVSPGLEGTTIGMQVYTVTHYHTLPSRPPALTGQGLLARVADWQPSSERRSGGHFWCRSVCCPTLFLGCREGPVLVSAVGCFSSETKSRGDYRQESRLMEDR